MTVNLYQALGVKRNATADEIKQAFRAKSMKHHPDRNPGDKKAAERFQKVVSAYRVLSDPERRQRYDETGDIQDMPDNNTAKSVSMLSQVFQTVLAKLMEQNLDFKRQDLPKLMRDFCSHQLTELAERRKVLEKAKLMIAPLQGRFSVKHGDNLMEEVAAFELTKIDKELSHMSESEKSTKQVLEWLQGCSFRQDEDMFASFLRGHFANGYSASVKVTKVTFLP